MSGLQIDAIPARIGTRASRLRRVLVLATVAVVAGGCNADSSDRYMETEDMEATVDVSSDAASAPPPMAAPVPRSQAASVARGLPQGLGASDSAAAAPTATPQVPAMIIWTGRARVEVDSMERAVEQVQALAQRVGGYVANTTIQAGDHQARQAEMELKIPSARFDEALSALRPMGELRSVAVNSQDVGEEFVDVSARVANARRLEERLLALLANRTGRLEDVLAVERELARVREEIERYEGRLRYLRTRVAMSTLTVTVAEPAPVVGDYPGSNPIADAFRQAWRNFVGFTAGFIASLGVLIPLALVGLALALLLRWIWRRFRRDDGPARRRFTRAEPSEPAPPPVDGAP